MRAFLSFLAGTGGFEGITHVLSKEKGGDVAGGSYACCFLVSRVSVCVGRGLSQAVCFRDTRGWGWGAVIQKVE